MSMIGGEKNCEDSANVVEDQKEPDISEFEYVSTEEELKGRIGDLEQDNEKLRGELRARNGELESLRAAKNEMAIQEDKIGILEYQNKMLQKLLKEAQNDFQTETIAKMTVSAELMKLKEEHAKTTKALDLEKERAAYLESYAEMIDKNRSAIVERKEKEMKELEDKKLEALKNEDKNHLESLAEARENFAKGVYKKMDTEEKLKLFLSQLYRIHLRNKVYYTETYDKQIEEVKKQLATEIRVTQVPKVEVPENGFVADVEFFRPRC